MTETCRTERREGRTRVLDTNDRNLLRYRREIEPEFRRILLDHDGLTALRDDRRDEAMRIDIRALHRIEDGPLHCFSRIKHDLMDLRNRRLTMHGLILYVTQPVYKLRHNFSLFVLKYTGPPGIPEGRNRDHQKSPVIFPSFTSMPNAAGFFGRPGMVMMSPVRQTTKPAPAET